MFGLKRNNISFEISKIPKRKKLCLTITKDNQTNIVASFNSEQSAIDFMNVLEYVCFENKWDEVIKIWEDKNV